MSIRSRCAAAALVLALGAVPAAAQQGTPPSPNMPAPAGLPDTDGAVGTGGEVAFEGRPEINPAIPLLAIVVGAGAALGIAALRRRSRT